MHILSQTLRALDERAEVAPVEEKILDANKDPVKKVQGQVLTLSQGTKARILWKADPLGRLRAIQSIALEAL